MSNKTPQQQPTVRQVDQLDLEDQIVNSYTTNGERACRRVARGVLGTLFDQLKGLTDRAEAQRKQIDDYATNVTAVKELCDKLWIKVDAADAAIDPTNLLEELCEEVNEICTVLDTIKVAAKDKADGQETKTAGA